jgi:hypothetical protein
MPETLWATLELAENPTVATPWVDASMFVPGIRWGQFQPPVRCQKYLTQSLKDAD